MKKLMKRIISLLLVAVLVIPMLPCVASPANAANTGLSLSQLRQKFPHGKYWNGGNADSYTSSPCNHHGSCSYNGSCGCNSFLALSIQCMGYAEKLGYDATGYNPRNNANGWYTYTSSSALDNLKPGDIVRYKNNGHSIYVTGVNGDTVTYTDCNSDGHCIIRWDVTISKSTLRSSFTHVRSAPSSVSPGPSSCSCSTSYAGTYICTTSTSNLTIRSGHGSSYSAIGSIPPGATVTVSKASGTGDGDWAHVTYNGVAGYASMQYLKKADDKKINISQSNVNLVIGVNETQTMYAWTTGYYNGNTSLRWEKNNSNVSCKWGEWNSEGKLPLTITANNRGETILTISVFDSDTERILDSKTVNVTVSAKTYTVSYNANGGSGAPGSQTKYHNTALTLSSTEPTRPGYVFMGWSTSSTATSATYQPGGSFTTNANTTLYAVWKENTIDLTRNATHSATITTGGEMKYFTYTPVSSGKYVIYSTGSDDTKVHLYNANWTELTSDDDSGDGNNFRLEYNLTAGTKYIFGVRYYSSSKTGTIPFKFGNVFAVTYDANGGSNAPVSQSKDYGTSITLRSTKPTRSGYTFLGWSTSSTAASATYQPGDSFSTNGNVTLYAVWLKGCEDDCHEFDYWVAQRPTVTGTGSLTGICDMCSGTTTVTLPKLDTTNYTYSTVEVATCTASGTGRYTWKTTTYGTFCFDVTVAQLNHSYSYKVTKSPTELATGILEGSCSQCSGTTTVTLPKLDITNYTYSVISEANCTTMGIGRYTWKITTFGNVSFQTIIPFSGHSYSYKATKTPTALETGRLEGSCSKCSSTTVVTLPKLNNADYEIVLAKAATCTEEGMLHYFWKTTDYGHFTFNVPVDATGHCFTHYVSNNDATYDADGTKTAKCDRCDATDTVIDEGSKLQQQNGWVSENGKWYYYKNGVKATGWLQLGSTWYYMDSQGVMQTGWRQISGVWYYFKSSGAMVTGWLQVGGTWYYFNASGAMVTGWLQSGSTWYYFNSSGAMVTGTVTIGGKVNKFDASGAWLGEVSQNGLVQEGGKWYYYQNGAKATGWKQISGKWYYFNTSGVMQTGWLQVGGTWYYFQSGGAMQTGWLKLGNTWYYFHSSGAMATSPVTLGGKTYRFDANGACLNP